MKTIPLVQDGADRPKNGPLIEVESPAENAAPLSPRDPALRLTRDSAIKNLFSKILLTLPDVAGASHDLSNLRRLLEQELADASALASKSASHSQQPHISSPLEER